MANSHLAEYVIVLTSRELRGRLMGHMVYHAVDYDILPLNPNISVQSPPHPVEAHLLALVRSHLHGSLLFFSYTWDLTRRLQSQCKMQEEDRAPWEVVRMATLYIDDASLVISQGRRTILLE